MAVKGSYAGKICRIDLSNGRVEKEDLSPEFAVKYAGGRGFSSRILFDEIKKGVEPLSEDNKLIFSVGALTGTPVPAASRSTIAAKSPLSNLHGDGHGGGYFGIYLKQAGFDVLIVEGCAEKPVYISIINGKVEIKNAEHLWGKSISAAEEIIKNEICSQRVEIASIGPAGENLVKLATIMNGQAAYARCGLGTVMGFKKLKAVVVGGDMDIEIADADKLYAAMDEYKRVITEDAYCPPAAKYGTPRFMMHRVKFGIHGAKNWRYGGFGWEGLSHEVFREKHTLKATSCPNCLMMCRRDMFIKDGPFAGTFTKVEWETIARSMTCGLTKTEDVIRFAKKLNEYGMDVEGVGDTIAFAMECYEKGILTKSDTGGMELNFGDIDCILDLVDKINYRQGLGDVLAEGTLRASKHIGKDSIKYAMQVKGVEMTAGDPRGMPVRAVSYATSTRGSDHLRSNPYIEEMISPEEGLKWFGSEEAASLKGVKGKGRMLKFSEDLVTIGDLLGLCKFAFYRSATLNFLYQKGVKLATDFYNACMGTSLTEEGMLEAGERTFNIEKAFNVREGADRSLDIIPERFFTEPIIGGSSDGAIVEREKFEKILDEYYESRGWDKSGIPTHKKMTELGLGDIADELNLK